MILVIVLVFAAGGAILYVAIGNTAPTTPAATKVAELCRLTFAAAVFAIMFSLALGTHDAILRVVK